MTSPHSFQTPGAVRLSVRALAGHFRKEIDVSLPTDVTLDEVIDEVATLMSAPELTKPWRATTAAGRPLDHTLALSQTHLADGSLILLRPHEPAPPPIIRDAAEALALTGKQTLPAGVISLVSTSGIFSLAALLSALFGVSIGCGCSCLIALVAALWCRPNNVIMASALLLGAAASAALLAQAPRLGIAVAALSVAGLCLIAHIARLASSRVIACGVTLAVFGAVASAGAYLPGLDFHREAHASATSAVTLCMCALVLTTAPGIAAAAAGLRVPQLPTAGEELAVADKDFSVSEAAAQHVRKIYEGIIFGCALACLVAVFFLSGPSSQGLLAAGRGCIVAVLILFAGTVALHASRHLTSSPLWPLSAMAVGSCFGLCAVGVRSVEKGGLSWPLLSACIIAALALLGAFVWAPRIPSLEPTTAVWLERLETACLVLLIPTAMHLTGLYVLLRGLG